MCVPTYDDVLINHFILFVCHIILYSVPTYLRKTQLCQSLAHRVDPLREETRSGSLESGTGGARCGRASR